ncbi:MAG TPA: ABC transporter permease [Candidatus Onthomonas avicola]|nr:ABC transporter permease [Candidatus Onthomonas avicola]
MRHFFHDLRRYYRYIFYSAKCLLKNEVANSFLNWIWLVLNPVLFMLVYAFVQIVIFGNETPYLASFIFIALTAWNFFNACINGSVRMMKRYQGIISKVYVPKFVFVLSNMMVNGFKMLVSFAITLLSVFLYQVPLSPLMLWSIPYLLLLFLITFGLSCILLHIGVFIDDLANIVQIGMRMLFFLSGVFYDLEGRLGGLGGVIAEHLNPAAHIILQLRHVLLYNIAPDLFWFLIWTVIGVFLTAVGVSLIYRYERRYVKSI